MLCEMAKTQDGWVFRTERPGLCAEVGIEDRTGLTLGGANHGSNRFMFPLLRLGSA